MSVDLLEPVLTDGIQNTHFFNGRILTAEALRTEQQAGRWQRWQLGRAAGHGIVCGLEIRLGNPGAPGQGVPTVHVTSGLAFNSLGQALALPKDKEVALAPEIGQSSVEAGLFGTCGQPN